MSKLIGKAVQGLSAGIGLAGEKYYDHKERKTALAKQEQQNRSTNDHEQGLHSDVNEKPVNDDIADDERIWALDEAADSPPPYKANDSTPDEIVAELARNVAKAKDHQIQIHSGEISRLPNAVVIPQRRPGSKERGWTRAYAPDLEMLGIDQTTFMRFLDGWDKAAQASPWFKAVTLTSGIVGMAIPGPITMAVTTAVSMAAEVGQELHGRYKANSFLDEMNKEVFMPAGLYAMVMICKLDASATDGIRLSLDNVNLENAKNISKYGVPGDHEQPPASTTSKFTRPLRIASGKSNVDEMPLDIAPLIYPGLDDMVKRPELTRDESFKERLMRNKDFVADYFDRRAQADFAGNNPNTALAKASGGTPDFKTRFADPNNACNNGHLVSLVTGGKVVAQGRGILGVRGGGSSGGGRQRGGLLGGRRDFNRGGGDPLIERGSRLTGRRQGISPGHQDEDDISYGRRRGSRLRDHGNRHQARGPQLREVGEDGKLLPRVKQPETQPRGPLGYALKGVKKVMKADVMYLTIVNLPTKEEMELAKDILGMDQRGWQDIIQGMRRA